MGAASYVTGAHAFRFGATVSTGNWRLTEARTGDVTPITYNAGRPVSVQLRLPVDRRNGIKADTGIFVQDRWTFSRITLNLGLRYDWFIGETRESEVLPSRFNAGTKFTKCADGNNDSRAGCVGKVQDWKDISPRIGFSMDVFGDGRTALKASVARYVAGQQIAVANAANPVTVLGLTDTRPWTDRDGNGLPLDADGNIQFGELSPSAATPTFGRNVSTTTTDPGVLDGWGKRGYNWEYTIAAQHQIASGLSVNGGYYRREFGNQTFTDDLRYDQSSYDSFCIMAPVDPNLPGGGGYQVCGVQDLKPAVFALNLPANNLIRFADDFGGISDVYQGFDVNIEKRFQGGGFLRGGINAQSRSFNDCNLIAAGLDAVVGAAAQGTETYEDGTRQCDRHYPFRPDAKISGSYPLPWGLQLSGTYQFTRGVQTGGAGPSVGASWPVINTVANPQIGRNWTGVASRTIQLMREGLDYGDHNLNQLDLRIGKRFRMDRVVVRLDFDLFNVFNSSWPFTISNTYSTAANGQWRRPTNVLQHRFFKLGGQLSF